MIPEVVVAMLACARIGAPHNVVFGGFSAEAVRERMEFSEAKLLITVDGAARKGKTAPVKDRVDEVMGDLQTLEKIVVVRSKGTPCEMQEGRDVFYDEILRGRRPGLPGRAARRRAPAVHPLHLGLDGQAEGHPAHDRRLPRPASRRRTATSSTCKPETDVYWCAADVGWVTGHSYIVYGPLANGATSVMWEGAPDYPDKGIWWEIVERYGVTILYCAPTAIRACIKWGAEWPDKHDLVSLRLLGSVGEPINPKAWLWYHKVIGGERCPIVDTWWQTETGAIMITPLPGHHRDQARLGDAAVPGRVRRGARRVDRRADRGGPGPARAHAAVAVDAAHALQGGRALRRDLLQALRPARPTSSATPRGATRTATSG